MSFPGRLVDTSAGRMFVHQAGSGPPLLLVHGMLVSHWYFGPVLGELARRFTVIAPDLLGHGESDRPPPSRFGYDAAAHARSLDELCGLLGLPPARVVSHSMGGGVGVALAARHPERVERLVVEDGWVYRIEMPLLGQLAVQPMVGDFLWKRLYGRRDLERHFRGIVRDPNVVSGEFVDYYWERLNRAGGRAAMLASLRAFAGVSDDNPDVARVRAPALVVWGEEDALFPLAHGRRLAEGIAGARLAVVPACGHSPHEERPADWLAAVLPFLDGAQAGGAEEGDPRVAVAHG